MTPMTRDEIKAFFEESYKVEQAIVGLVHREALPALKALEAMRDIVGEQLPGGYYGACLGCDEVRGHDEMVGCGDEDLCQSCVERMQAELSREAQRR